MQCTEQPFITGKGIVDLIFFSVEEVLAVPKIQLALKNEGTEFLGIETIEWMGFPELGLGCVSTGLDKFIDSCDNLDSICFHGVDCSWCILIVHGINLY